MENTWYLPEEIIDFQNYPEVTGVLDSISAIQNYTMRVINALQDYTDGTLDKIDINVTDLQKYINLCRSVLDTLGHAPNVCYDLLMELRETQSVFQTLMYAYNQFGSQYIGTPTDQTTAANSDVI
jgi:5'(3')-deoxyribonucleotidase